MSCSNCFNGCVETTSDKCVKYTGIDVPILGIKKGDSLSYVEQALIEFLTSTLDGSGIKLDIPEAYNKAIRHYVLSQAWKDDMDSANLNLSEIEFKYYINELSYIAKLSSLDNTLGQQYRPIYNTVFDF